MRTMKLAIAALLVTTSLVTAQTEPPPWPPPTAIQVGEGLYVIQTFIPGVMAMNNLLLVRPDRVVLVDTMIPLPGFYEIYLPVIHGATGDRPVDTLISTHWHGDHTALNARFRTDERTGTIIGHWRTGDFMDEDRWIEDLGMFIPASPPEGLPTQVVHGEKRFPLKGETIVLKTVENAHSDSDLLVYLERANVVYTGDLYFGRMFPVIDRSSGGTVNGMLHACRQLLASINSRTLVIPSHGPPGNRESVLEFVQMVETCRDRVRALIAAGMTEGEAVAAKPLAVLEAIWGGGMLSGDMFTMIVYRDLQPQRGF